MPRDPLGAEDNRRMTLRLVCSERPPGENALLDFMNDENLSFIEAVIFSKLHYNAVHVLKMRPCSILSCTPGPRL